MKCFTYSLNHSSNLATMTSLDIQIHVGDSYLWHFGGLINNSNISLHNTSESITFEYYFLRQDLNL